MITKIKATKTVLLMYPQTKNNGAFANNTYVDTQGYDHLRVIIAVGVTDAAVGSTAANAAPFLEECETSGGSYSAVTDAALTAVIPTTAAGKLYGFDINLNKSHKQFMRVNAPTAANATGAAACIIAILSEKFDGDLPDGSEFTELVEA